MLCKITMEKSGRRLSALPVQAFLATARSPRPERELAALLSNLTGTEVAITSPWGEVLAGRITGSALTREVRDEGQLLGRLVFKGAVEDEELLSLAAEVYTVIALQRAARIARAAAGGEALLAELLSGSRAADLSERLALHGLEDEPYAVAVTELWGRRARSRTARQLLAGDLEQLRAAGDALFHARAHRALSAVRGGRVVWWWTTSDPQGQADGLLSALLVSTREDVRLGLSETHAEVGRGNSALTQALLALGSTRTARSCALFSTLDPLHWVLSSLPPDHLRLWRDGLLGPLRRADEDGRLLDTLRAYLHDPDHKSALAERLNIHPNTLRYRLGKIEELLGQPLSHPATLARLYLALGPEA